MSDFMADFHMNLIQFTYARSAENHISKDPIELFIVFGLDFD